jgi:hypothetical protein
MQPNNNSSSSSSSSKNSDRTSDNDELQLINSSNKQLSNVERPSGEQSSNDEQPNSDEQSRELQLITKYYVTFNFLLLMVYKTLKPNFTLALVLSSYINP